MKKFLIFSSFLLLFVLAIFFSCTKDVPMPTVQDLTQSQILSMTMDSNGIANIAIAVRPSHDNTVKDRDGCTMYEALRFTNRNGSNFPDSTTRVASYVKFRLIKISKSTPHTRTALTYYTILDSAATDGTGVGGVNISWYNYDSIPGYWYGTEINYCYPRTDFGVATYAVSDFWNGIDPTVQTYPWTCANVEAAEFYPDEIKNGTADQVIVYATLHSDCSITGEVANYCYFIPN